MKPSAGIDYIAFPILFCRLPSLVMNSCRIVAVGGAHRLVRIAAGHQSKGWIVSVAPITRRTASRRIFSVAQMDLEPIRK